MKGNAKYQLFLLSFCTLHVKGVIPNGITPIDIKFHDTVAQQVLENAIKKIDLVNDATNSENGTLNLLENPEGTFYKEDEVSTEHKLSKHQFLYDPNALKELVGLERKIYLKMKEYVENVDKRLKIFRDYIQDYEESLLEDRNDDDFMEELEYNTVANPLVSYRMMRRFALDLPTLYESSQLNYESEFQKAVIETKGEMIYPNQIDHREALRSIIRIQRYTSLDPYELSNGKLGDMQTTAGLLPVHDFEIGIEARNQGRFAMAIEWFEVALDKLDRNFTQEKDILIAVIEHELLKTVEMHDKEWKIMSSSNENAFTEQIGDNYGPHKVPRIKTYSILKNYSISTRNVTQFSPHIKNNFVSLCSGQNLQSEAEKAQLNCYYEAKKHPYLRINPMKIEILHQNPPLLQIYDFIGPQAINNIIQAATPGLVRSGVVSAYETDPEDPFVSEHRTSSQIGLEEFRYPVLDRMQKLIEALTGLVVKGSQCSHLFQIASYGSSHHYDVHMDALMDRRKIVETGDRIGTFMIYLSDVEVGGKTAFPTFGTATSPVKGSAVFWYNLHKNGEPDYRTWHGGCPVVHGIKWVANKWILSNCNWRSVPCSLKQAE